MVHPFEVPADALQQRMDDLVQDVMENLESHFLTLPQGPGFVNYPRFAEAWDVLHKTTKALGHWEFATVWESFQRDRLVFVVLRTMLGLSPPEWADMTQEKTGIEVTQSNARIFDRDFRQDERKNRRPQTIQKIEAMIRTAVSTLAARVPEVPEGTIHRFDKADTQFGLESVEHVARRGIPYPVLLYERFLGRPFASHRDAVSELIGDLMEVAVEKELETAGVPYRRTGRAERIPGFELAPDFLIPDEFRPRIAIEAKITQDDGTARDKVTRIQHLATLSRRQEREGGQPFQVVACIDGRGFGVRASDIRKLILDTGGKVFTIKTLVELVDHTDLVQFRALAG